MSLLEHAYLLNIEYHRPSNLQWWNTFVHVVALMERLCICLTLM